MRTLCTSIQNISKQVILPEEKSLHNSSVEEWCRVYLTDRQQRVVVKGEVPDWLTITSGVPQGSL